MGYMSETAKVQDSPHIMEFIKGKILDYGCGGSKITPDAVGVDGRALPGVDTVVPDLENPPRKLVADWTESFDTVFSSHFLEHVVNPYDMVMMWYQFLIPQGKLVLYLPDGKYYNNNENPEHMQDINYENFIFWFKRVFCGEGKNYRGEHLPKYFEIIHQGNDVGNDRYSFFIVARAV